MINNFFQFVIHISPKMLSNIPHTPLDVSQVCPDIANLSLYPIYVILEITALPLQTVTVVNVNAVERFQATLGR
jgi:hypothetical protein